MLGGATEADGGVCSLRGVDAVRILEAEFGVRYTLDGVYDLLHRLRLSCLVPRPRHRKNDPAGHAAVAGGRPPFVQRVKDAHPGERVEVWQQDEARIGQQGTLTRVWGETGSRPSAVRQTEYEWAYLFAAVNPLTGASSALIAPTVNTQYMNKHLAFIGREAGPGVHVVLVLDQAGWHVAKALRVPKNVTLLHLPPYSPELNGSERIWGVPAQPLPQQPRLQGLRRAVRGDQGGVEPPGAGTTQNPDPCLMDRARGLIRMRITVQKGLAHPAVQALPDSRC